MPQHVLYLITAIVDQSTPAYVLHSLCVYLLPGLPHLAPSELPLSDAPDSTTIFYLACILTFSVYTTNEPGY